MPLAEYPTAESSVLNIDPREPERSLAGSVAATPVPASTQRRRLGSDGEESETDSGSGEDSSGKARAAQSLHLIFAEYNRLREIGRSPAWAELQKRLAEAGSLLITTGMISLKDVVGTLQNIEEFRKSEGGNQVLPADYLAQWLSEKVAEPTPVVHVRSIKEPKVKKTGKKAAKVK